VSTPPAAIDADLGWALGAVYRSYLKAVEAVVSDLPGGPRGYQVLTSAVHDGAGNQADLAVQLGIDRTVLTYLIDDLEECGLVERQADPRDRRRRRIAATHNGTTVWTQRCAALEHVERHLLGSLGADADTFRLLLRHLAAHTDEFDPSTSEAVEHLERLDETPNSRARRRKPDPLSP